MGSLVIHMYPGDHPAPHFHVWYPGYKLKLPIRELTEKDTRGFPKSPGRTLRRWVRERLPELEAEWERCERGMPPRRIPPL